MSRNLPPLNDMIRALTVEAGHVRFVLEAPSGRGKAAKPVMDAAKTALSALAGVVSVSVVLTEETAPPPPPPDLQTRSRAKTPDGPEGLPDVAKIILVGSGKGGVGKSTVTANLAVSFAAMGLRVGLLDADIYGPSQPRMLGVSGRPASPDGTTILPLRNHGVTLMSVGLMTQDDEAVIWRGPLLMGALQQMLKQVQWGVLDILLIDLPPGTGDVQLTLAQKVRINGAVIVSTPQDIALMDARKAMNMFEKMETPILGIVENMSSYICRNCGHEEHIFGHGGAQGEANRLGLPFLGEIPLDLDIRLASDGGAPVVVTNPEGPQARVFLDIARKLLAGGA